jgi:regulator of RNase E activity RraA
MFRILTLPCHRSTVIESARTDTTEGSVNKIRGFIGKNTTASCVLFICTVGITLFAVRFLRAEVAQETNTASSDSALIAEFRRVEVASVSDAIEQLTGKRMYMSHRMTPIFTTKFAGIARTVSLKKDEGNTDPAALNGMLQAIDEGSMDSVYVMAVEDGENIAGMGGLMGTAMAARGYAGAVIDGGVRDVAYLRKIGFPVYATGIVPSTSVHHYRFGGSQVPITCDGVIVNAGDIVTADSDGVVVVPRAKAREVLALAQQMDFKEHSMYAVIEQMKSIVEAVKKFGRL